MPYDNSKYSNYNRSGGYSPKKPVKSFMDLEIYQKALEASVAVSKILEKKAPFSTRPTEQSFGREGGEGDLNHRPAAEVAASCSESRKGHGDIPETAGNVGSGTAKRQDNLGAGTMIFHNMLPCALGLPHLIAEAHSYRFGSGTDCLVLLEKTMVNCNKMVVYLEQVRDICQTGLEHDFFEELIKKYLYIRRKTLNLQRVWKKYIEHPNADFAPAFGKRPL